jgi:hypothetical protein
VASCAPNSRPSPDAVSAGTRLSPGPGHRVQSLLIA